MLKRFFAAGAVALTVIANVIGGGASVVANAAPVEVVATEVAPVVSVLTDTTNAIDVTIVDSILEVTKTILGMFSVFPLNVFLTASLVGIGIGVFRKLKKS